MPASPKVQRPLTIKAFPRVQQHPSGRVASPMLRLSVAATAKTVTSPRSSQPLACARVCDLTPSIRNAHEHCGRRAKRWSTNVLTKTEPRRRGTQGDDMCTQTSDLQLAERGKGEVIIPLIRAAATIGFAIAPCSLGFVIIAVSEHVVRSIMVGDDPEMLMSDLQNQFPNDVIEIIENDAAGLIAKVLGSLITPQASHLAG